MIRSPARAAPLDSCDSTRTAGSFGSITIPMRVEGMFFQVSAADRAQLPSSPPLPLAGRGAIRAALRRSLSREDRTRHRSAERVTRLRLALGRGAVALELPDDDSRTG